MYNLFSSKLQMAQAVQMVLTVQTFELFEHFTWGKPKCHKLYLNYVKNYAQKGVPAWVKGYPTVLIYKENVDSLVNYHINHGISTS